MTYLFPDEPPIATLAMEAPVIHSHPNTTQRTKNLQTYTHLPLQLHHRLVESIPPITSNSDISHHDHQTTRRPSTTTVNVENHHCRGPICKIGDALHHTNSKSRCSDPLYTGGLRQQPPDNIVKSPAVDFFPLVHPGTNIQIVKMKLVTYSKLVRKITTRPTRVSDYPWFAIR
ncbi:unnamed protein product [Lactuca saligna]|uniref:Uncharacterized protein n=1 Tax=Lactuca saligna TaxID=75948 RepID=A0AA35Z309_LACSI|nr:unnamed protein product [Lactuca saligna]